jgi:hypothetical protein
MEMKMLRYMNSARFIILVWGTLVMAGCMSIPVTELNQYKQAFSEVQNVSETILLDYDQALKESRSFVEQAQAGKTKGRPKPAFPDSLASFSKESGTKTDNDIMVRRQALVVIDRYNQTLTQLASNESIREIKSSTESFGNAVNRFAESAVGASFPGAQGVIDLAKMITGQIEKARLRKEFETAVKDGVPLISKIFSILIEDTASHYEATSILYYRRVTLITADIVENVGEMGKLFSSHTAPPADDFTSLKDRAQELNTTLLPLENSLSSFGYPYEFRPALPDVAAIPPAPEQPTPEQPTPEQPTLGQPTPEPPAYTEAINGEIDSRMRAIKELLSRYERDVSTVTALGAALENYRALLRAARTSMNSLLKALNKPQDLESSINELLSLSFEVKRDIEAVRSATAAVQ